MIPFTPLFLVKIRYYLTADQLEIPTREDYDLHKGCRISFSPSLLSSFAVLRMAQTEERAEGSSSFAPVRWFLLTLQYVFEIMINYNLITFIPELGKHSWLCK